MSVQCPSVPLLRKSCKNGTYPVQRSFLIEKLDVTRLTGDFNSIERKKLAEFSIRCR